MEELKLTVEEAAERLVLSPSSVYTWIEKNKLIVDDSTGQKLIVISSSDADIIRERNLKSKRIRNSNKFQEDSNNLQENTIKDVENSNNLQQQFQNIPVNYNNSNNFDPILILEKYENYILKAGQVLQLEDSQKRAEGDKEHWMKLFFEMKYNHESLQERYNKLQEEFENYKKNSFKKPWKIN